MSQEREVLTKLFNQLWLKILMLNTFFFTLYSMRVFLMCGLLKFEGGRVEINKIDYSAACAGRGGGKRRRESSRQEDGKKINKLLKVCIQL